MSRVPRAVTRLEALQPALQRLAGSAVRLWRAEAGAARPLDGTTAAWTPLLNGSGEPAGRALDTPSGPAWFEPVPDVAGVWLELAGARAGERAGDLARIAGAVLSAERESVQVAAELSARYEEIDLIYTISEILGHTIRLDEAAQRILQEVSTVVGARRATLLVHDQERAVLTLVAQRGLDVKEIEPVEVDDPCSVTARVFRERRILSYDPTTPGGEDPSCGEGRGYRGRSFLSVPIMYASPGQPPRPIGVINLTDRVGEDAFTAGDRKLVAAIANQIGAAIENARLVARDLQQQQVQHELQLAHDLQLKLLPSPLVIAAKADVAVRCVPAESVGGDFYNLLRLHGDRIGVMIGDVSSHGFGAAIIMALAMAASGIHAESAESPAAVLDRLQESLDSELSRTEMFLTLFYAVLDPIRGRLTFANAGHAHAFVVPPDGEPVRLSATRPPLGFGPAEGADVERPWRRRGDLLVLFTDGVAEALGPRGERFGEQRILGHARRMQQRPTREILDAIFTELEAFTDGTSAGDDRTVVLLRA